MLRNTAGGFADNELMTRAAALAFYSALILLLGAELTQGVAEARGGAIQPRCRASAADAGCRGRPRLRT